MLPCHRGNTRPHFAVRCDVSNLEARISIRLSLQDDLVTSPRLKPRHLHPVSHARCFQKGVVIVHHRIVERARVIVIRPSPIEHHADRDVLCDVGDARQLVVSRSGVFGLRVDPAHVVPVKMGDESIVDRRLGIVGKHPVGIARDPLARPARPVRGARGASRRLRIPVPGINEERRAVRKYQERNIAPAGVDLMNVEHAQSPGRQGLTDGLR